MEIQAIEIGIPATDYWSMTFDEIMIQCSANKKIKERDIKEKAMLDYSLIQGILYAFNDPKNMPKAEKLYPILDEQKQVENKQPQELSEQKPYNADHDQAIFMEMARGVKRINKSKE
ncbi:hypothetical protein [Vagococcus hydrophili]|uniref:Uncharacterized protein n=1 Tax=Vagococcus hydrophili TaxID=2714947 RepID=A0A6G8AQ18_9ENTE|nr:hypothetical protein [Vagococcus hydrophili]QIL47032.1 hypothetical protein G7082_00045 [Vagococcus hydrophili]